MSREIGGRKMMASDKRKRYWVEVLFLIFRVMSICFNLFAHLSLWPIVLVAFCLVPVFLRICCVIIT